MRNFWLICTLILAQFETSLGTGIFYENSLQFVYTCSVQFENPRRFDCACINGLWMLKGESCNETIAVAGQNHYCFDLTDTSISRAVQVLQHAEDIAVQKTDGTVIPLQRSGGMQFAKAEFTSNDVLITGSPWTIVDNTGQQYCLSVLENSFCYFKFPIAFLDVQLSFRQGCESSSKELPPFNCVDIYETEDSTCQKPHIHKRSVDGYFTNSMGRVFFGAPGQNFTTFNASGVASNPNSTLIYDEDLPPLNTTNPIPHDAIASELFNHFEKVLDEILELKMLDNVETNWNETRPLNTSTLIRSKRGVGRNIATQNKTDAKNLTENYTVPETMRGHKAPIYVLLQLSKDIMKKTCPSFYVGSDFFDMAVSAFINLQKTHFKFPNTVHNFKGYWRIVDSLLACKNRSTPFPFVKENCTSIDKPVTGKFCEKGINCTELNIHWDSEEPYEPIIETVWNVFKNAHAHCFPYFNKRYNDHHLFTTWMIPLFQNDINDIWVTGTPKGNVYGGVFGNQENIQIAVTYCTAYSQLTTNYPWELQRPLKVPGYGGKKNNGTTEPSGGPSKAGATRRKRQLHNLKTADSGAQCIWSQQIQCS